MTSSRAEVDVFSEAIRARNQPHGSVAAVEIVRMRRVLLMSCGVSVPIATLMGPPIAMIMGPGGGPTTTPQMARLGGRVETTCAVRVGAFVGGAAAAS